MIKIATYEFPVIYVYRIDDEKHKGMLKVGQTSIEAENANMLAPDCDELRNKAIARINQQTGTASIDYELLYAELAFFEEDGVKYHFADFDVRQILYNSDYKNANLTNNQGAVAHEWVKVDDVEIVKKAIAAVKERRNSLDPEDFKKIEKQKKVEIKFREEQEKAINDTRTRFLTGKQMLWNAKMRFGKTLCALEVIKEQNYRRTLIITHRPSVRSGWFEDFNLLDFGDDFYFSFKKDSYKPKSSPDDTEEQKEINELIEARVKKLNVVEPLATEGKANYIYFASIQDLRGSWDKATGKYKKNQDVFETDWDLLIVDEAHEGTKTELGQSVIAELQKHRNMRTLYLSGTPYNILENFNQDEVYSWTYEMEQEAKQRWYDQRPNEPNPYEDLPRLEMHTYNIDDVFNYERDAENDFFNFAEFFRVDKENTGNFVHEKEVKDFLDLLCKEGTDSNYPYSTEEYRFALSHTLWVLPGVAEAAAMSKLIKEHNILKEYQVINVAGDGDDDQDNTNSVQNVKDNIAVHPKTITLTCGRLTTGVSVPEWSAVFMLCGGANISAAFYLQTIFRAQTPTRRNVFPKKKVCYAFDFAPDRAIEVINEYVEQQRKSSPQNSQATHQQAVENTLNFVAIIAHEGSKEIKYDTMSFMREIGHAYKEHIKRRGFRDRRLFVDLGKLTDEQYRAIGDIGLKMKDSGHAFSSGGSGTDGILQLAKAGLEGKGKGGKNGGKGKKDKNEKPNKPISPRPKKPADKSKEAFKVLGEIYTRLPMLIFGCDLKEKDITLQNILEEVDDASWAVFMPSGVGKAEMRALMELNILQEDRFAAAASDIPKEIEAADQLPITDRVRAIAAMIARFRFPDKETVLTPWRVVNMHLSDTVGGYDFFDESHTNELLEPRLVCHPDITPEVFKPNARVLEINSKSGLYPLYMAYSLYRTRLKAPQAELFAAPIETDEDKLALWDSVLRENLYVLCMSEMAAKITRRVLTGYRDARTNVRAYLKNRDLITDIKVKNQFQNVVARIKGQNNFWGNNTNNMNFDAIVGNPPYMLKKDDTSDTPIYHHFMDLSFALSEKSTLITPARFLFNAGKTPSEWNNKVLNDEHLKVVWCKNSDEVFPNVDIKGGVAVTYRDGRIKYGKIGVYSRFPQLITIRNKVINHKDFVDIKGIIYLQNKFNLKALYKDYPNYRDLIGSHGREKRLTTPIFESLEIFKDRKSEDGELTIHGLIKNNRCTRAVKNLYIEDNGNLNFYKVLLPASNGSGAIGEVLSTPLCGEPLCGFTQSFISFGKFETFEEAEFAMKYVKSKFARAMLGILKVTQHNHIDVWTYVPLQDFTAESDIDWSRSVAEIDRQLYDKYGLTDEERQFIESMIKPME